MSGVGLTPQCVIPYIMGAGGDYVLRRCTFNMPATKCAISDRQNSECPIVELLCRGLRSKRGGLMGVVNLFQVQEQSIHDTTSTISDIFTFRISIQIMTIFDSSHSFFFHFPSILLKMILVSASCAHTVHGFVLERIRKWRVKHPSARPTGI